MALSSTTCDFCSGWIAGMAGLIVGHPIDTLKVRQQILGRPMLESISNINKAGGVLTFFRGMGIPLLTTGAMNSIFFGCYGTTLDFILDRRRNADGSVYESKDFNRHFLVESYWDYFVAGCIGGAGQLIVACPVDLVKVQLQSQLHKSIVKGPVDCMQLIIRSNGVFGLYKGLGAQSCRDIPASGLYFVIYEFFKANLTFGHKQSTKFSQFMAGGLAGILSWWAIIPFDVIKSRIQGDTNHEQRKYRGIVHCSTVILKEHGIKGLFHGFLPLSLRAFPVNGTTFLVYEWLFGHCKHYQNNQYL